MKNGFFIFLICCTCFVKLKAQERANAAYTAPDYKGANRIYIDAPDPEFFDFKRAGGRGRACEAILILSEQGISASQAQSSLEQKLKNIQAKLLIGGIISSAFRSQFLTVVRQPSSNKLSSTVELKKKVTVSFKRADKLQTIIDSFLLSNLVVELQGVEEN